MLLRTLEPYTNITLNILILICVLNSLLFNLSLFPIISTPPLFFFLSLSLSLYACMHMRMCAFVYVIVVKSDFIA